MRKKNKVISVLVILAFLFQIVSMPVLAMAQPVSKPEPKAVTKNDKPKSEGKIIGEVKEKREKNVKHFLRDDNTFEAAIYPSAVHYKDGDEWKDIDNTLIEEVNENNQGVLVNKENDYRVQIAKNSKARNLVRIKKDKYEVSWNIENPDHTLAEVRSKDLDFLDSLSESERKKTLTNINSIVDYKDIYPNIDLSYEIEPEGVKENIIIKERVDNPSFSFELRVKNLIPELQEDKTIIFYDQETSEEIFLIEAPFMYDAKGAESRDIEVTFEPTKGGYYLTIIPDNDWLASSDRVYPVTVDPILSTSLDTTKIYDAHVSENYANENFRDSVVLRVGKGASSGITRNYMSFDLPSLKTSDLITYAQLDLSLYQDSYDNVQIDAHKVTENWSSSTITWNNKADYNNKIEEFQMVEGVAGDYFTWNITDIVKEWYTSDNNYGLMLKNHNENEPISLFFSSDTSSSYEAYRPQVTLFYVNNSGLENYWTYHSQDLGRAGTGHVNDYNGNLVFVHNDVSMSGNRMPLTLNPIFNSSDREQDINYGKGWRLNLNQRVQWKEIDGTSYYEYTDEDGTIHYFKWDSPNTYKDESGLNLTLTYDENSTSERFKITDKKGNELNFEPWGYLTSIKDSNGNALTLNYDNYVLKEVNDGAGRTTNLNYDAAGKLQGVIEPDGKTTTYSYNSGNLTKITYPDNKYSSFTYDTNNNLTSVTNVDGYKIEYSYYDVSPYRVKNIQEKHSDGKIGKDLAISYGYNTTSFTDYKGRKTTYQFNNWGNTISVQDDNGHAQYYKFITADDGNTPNNNKLVNQSKLQKSIINHIRNHRIQADGYWFEGSWGNSTANLEFTTEESYVGDRSLKINKTNTDEMHHYWQELSLEKGETYTYSGYIKTNNISSSNDKGAALVLSYQDNSGEWIHVYSDYVNGTKDWERQEVSFTIPSDAASATVYIRGSMVEEIGTAYFDALQLEEGSIANRYNLLENPDFKYGSSDTPTFWTKNWETDSSDIWTAVETPKGLDDKVFKLNGVAGKNKNLFQTTDVSGQAGDTFVMGGWAKGDSVPLDTGRFFGIHIGIQNTDGTWQWENVQFNEDSSEWQYISDAVVAQKDYSGVNIYLTYYDNANSAYFDGIQLYKEEFSQSYTYDAEGNLISTQDLAEQNQSFEYNTSNDLIKSIDPKGNSFNYNYDSNHNLLDATSAENVKYTFTYDEYGNPEKAKVGDSTLFIESSATYTDNGNYIKTVTDATGNTVTYNWDETKGLLGSLVDAKGKTTSYQYDSLDRLESVSKNVGGQNITNNYAYENDRLKSFTHNGFSYNFNFNDFGNTTSVSVGSQNLITNIFEQYTKGDGSIIETGKLLESQYGNGQKSSYDYDDLDRVKAIKFNGQTRFKNEYDANGNLGYHEDLVNNTSFRYYYDLSDRLSRIIKANGDSTSYEFDANNNVSEFKEIIGANSYSTSYQYDKDNRPTSVLYPDDLKNIGYSYDTIGRLTNKSINTGSTQYPTNFSYKAGVNGSSTNKIESIENNGQSISYNYDENGNIKTITEAGKTITYYYDELNQLIREDNEKENKTITYSYDQGGNILEKTEYPYTTGTLGTPTRTYSYSYGDTNWKDKLTSFDGKGVTYDEIGNPLTYDGYNYSWEEGRQLAGISGNGLDISYKYNASGIRTEKTVNGVTTKYHVVGDQVTYETNGTDEIYYTYDVDGGLVSMNLNGAEYFYIRNAQGDIIGLIDETGEEVVSYSYDTWGKVLAVEGSLASTVGEANPYLYRGYRYDSETGLYYLQSRYYNPDWGRFINADNIGGQVGGLLTHNVFVYAWNNPVMFVDPSGHWPSLGDIWNGVKSTAKTVANFVVDTVQSVTRTVKDAVSSASEKVKEAVGQPITSVGTVVEKTADPKNVHPEVEKMTKGLKPLAKASSPLTVVDAWLTVKDDLSNGYTNRAFAKAGTIIAFNTITSAVIGLNAFLHFGGGLFAGSVSGGVGAIPIAAHFIGSTAAIIYISDNFRRRTLNSLDKIEK